VTCAQDVYLRSHRFHQMPTSDRRPSGSAPNSSSSNSRFKLMELSGFRTSWISWWTSGRSWRAAPLAGDGLASLAVPGRRLQPLLVLRSSHSIAPPRPCAPLPPAQIAERAPQQEEGGDPGQCVLAGVLGHSRQGGEHIQQPAAAADIMPSPGPPCAAASAMSR